VRWLGRVAVLTALWLLAWGEPSLPNVLTGVLVAAALLVAFPPDLSHQRARIDLLASVRLLAYVVRQLVTSNVEMTLTTLRPRPDIRPGVLAHRLLDPSDRVVTAMTSVIALSPGTMTVDVSEDATTIYVHFLRLHDVEAARASLRHLEDLVERALPRTSPEPVPPAPGERT
jgi:multicomponent Na+:H+ antiporter subunit E